MFGKKADDKIAKKQAEQEAKDKAAMEKFGVDFDSYTSDDIKEKNVASLKEIASSLAGSKMYSFGSLLSGNSNETSRWKCHAHRLNRISFLCVRMKKLSAC